MCVLVVEDDEILGAIYVRNLHKLGRKVSLAVNGEQAIEKAKKAQYSLVLMDLGLPGKDGLETSKKLREMGHNEPIVAITAGHSSPLECHDAGINDYYIKPMLISQLTEILDKYNLFYNPPPPNPC